MAALYASLNRPSCAAAVVLLAALLVAGLTARLGVWQLNRASTKLGLQAARDAADRLPPLGVRRRFPTSSQ